MNNEWIKAAQEEAGLRVFGWSKRMRRTHWPPALLPGQCIEDLEWLSGQLHPPPFVVWGVPGGADLVCHLRAACLRLDRCHGIRPRLLILLDEMVGPCPPSVSVVRSFFGCHRDCSSPYRHFPPGLQSSPWWSASRCSVRRNLQQQQQPRERITVSLALLGSPLDNSSDQQRNWASLRCRRGAAPSSPA